MKKIVLFTPPDAYPGFKLAGIDHFATEGGNLMELLAKVSNDPDAGIIIIDERLVNIIGHDNFQNFESGFAGVILTLPAPERYMVEMEDYAAMLIRRAIGYHIRLQT